MTTEINRIKKDLATIEEAIGYKPDKKVFVTLAGCFVLGMYIALVGIFQKAIPFRWAQGTVLGLVLIFAFIGWRQTPVCEKSSQNMFLNVLIVIFSAAIVVWLIKFTVPLKIVHGVMSIVGGICLFFLAWGKPWRRYYYAFALSFTVLGFACPLLTQQMEWTSLGISLVFGSGIGAAILHLQLRASKDGKTSY